MEHGSRVKALAGASCGQGLSQGSLHTQVISLDIGGMVAGAKYRGRSSRNTGHGQCLLALDPGFETTVMFIQSHVKVTLFVGHRHLLRRARAWQRA